ncbi:hypothetical protein AB0323_17585 [Arthrobacter sp. NPDC080031]|uniref:hypothetical protein n=1 Tax=Arthrobacter sp. NPDC080031 TaxID=3155918 RepID=UPI00344D9108
MSTETNEPDPPVQDGVQNDTDPVSRDPIGSTAAEKGPSGGHVPLAEEDAGEPSETGSEDPPGPAEEQNRASADDRGLTTEVSPSD